MRHDQEQAARQRAIDLARASIKLEGFRLTSEIEQINRQFVSGEISGDEHVTQIRATVLGLPR